MNKKTYLIVLVTCGLILAALMFREGGLLLLSLPFLVYFTIGLLQAPTTVRLTAQRLLSTSSAKATETVETRIAVTNQGQELKNLQLEDRPYAGMQISDGETYCRRSVPANGTTELAYTFTPSRGVFRWETLRATGSDPFGLFEISMEVPAGGNLLVHPIPLDLKTQKLRPHTTIPTAGPILARKAGLGTDFWGIRDYRTGDSLRRINWRLTARHPSSFFTNEYEREEIADFGIIVDARARTNAEAMESELFEHTVSAAASVGKTILRNGNRVSLLVFGKTILTAYPGSGKQQLDLLLWTLARAKLRGNLSFANIKRFPPRLFPARSLLVVFSPVSPRDIKAYARLRSFGYEVILLSPDLNTFGHRFRSDSKRDDLAFRAARVERLLLLKKLAKLGVQVIDWQVDRPLEPLLEETARHMTQRRVI